MSPLYNAHWVVTKATDYCFWISNVEIFLLALTYCLQFTIVTGRYLQLKWMYTYIGSLTRREKKPFCPPQSFSSIPQEGCWSSRCSTLTLHSIDGIVRNGEPHLLSPPCCSLPQLMVWRDDNNRLGNKPFKVLQLATLCRSIHIGLGGEG